MVGPIRNSGSPALSMIWGRLSAQRSSFSGGFLVARNRRRVDFIESAGEPHSLIGSRGALPMPRPLAEVGTCEEILAASPFRSSPEFPAAVIEPVRLGGGLALGGVSFRY